MSAAWFPIATRGCFDARIWTRARLLEEKMLAALIPLPYLAVLTPHGEDSESTPIWFESLDALAAWVKDVQPKVLHAHTAGPEAGEDCDELLAFLRRGAATN